MLMLICFSVFTSGCFGDEPEAAKTPTEEVILPNKSETYLRNLEMTDITLIDIGSQNPDTLESLTTYGISKVTQLQHPNTNTFGWRYEFATVKGCQFYTEKVISSPEYSIGIHGEVIGKAVLLGAVPSYYFTNDQTHHYVTPIGNVLVIMSGADLSSTYTSSKMITQNTYRNTGSPDSIIPMEKINKQIYPENSKETKTSTPADTSTTQQQVMNSDYSSFFS